MPYSLTTWKYAVGANDPNREHFSTEHLLTNLKGRTISSGLVTTMSQGAQFVLVVGSTMVLARLLAPADFGLLAMVLTVMGFLRVFKDAGLSTATVQREEITHAQVSNLFWINLGLGGASSLIMAACAPLIAWFYHEPRLVAVTVVLSASFLLTGAAVQQMALLSRQMRFKAIAFVQVSSQIASVAVGILMAWAGYGYWSLVGLQLTSPLVTMPLTWFACRWRPRFFCRGAGIRSMLSFGANLTATSFIYSLAGGVDSLLIGRFYGADPVGLYSRAGALLRRPLDQFLSPINAVFVPVLSRIQTQPERYRRTFIQVYEAITLMCFFVAGMFLALSRPLTLVVLGPKWEKAIVIFGAFTFSALYYPLTNTCGWLFESQGRGKDALHTSLVSSIIAICCIGLGLPFGAAGVAIVISASGILLQLPIFFHMVGRAGPVSAADLWRGFFRYLPVWGIVCGATFLARTLVVERSSLAQLLVCAPVGLLTGVAFVCVYSPARQTALSLFDALRQLRRGSGEPLMRDD